MWQQALTYGTFSSGRVISLTWHEQWCDIYSTPLVHRSILKRFYGSAFYVIVRLDKTALLARMYVSLGGISGHLCLSSLTLSLQTCVLMERAHGVVKRRRRRLL